MKVSIIIPVYNVLPYLKRCLDSVINQTLTDLEVIIIDDGSVDGSAEFVDEYAKSDPRIIVKHKDNGGLMSAWTTGVRLSHGEYIGFVDSDDYISLDMYQTMLQTAEQYDTDIVICNYSINHAIEGKLKTQLREGLYIGSRLQTDIKEHVLPLPGTYSIPLSRLNKLFRRSIALECLKYTESLSRTFEDRYFVPATLLCSKSVYCLDDVFYYWILREGSNHGLYKPNLLEEIKRYYNVQHMIVRDYAPSLEDHWELSFCDGIKQYVIRNIVNVKDFHTRYESAKKLFGDSLVAERMNKYGPRLTNKMGRLLNFCFKIHSPLFLAILCPIGMHLSH